MKKRLVILGGPGAGTLIAAVAFAAAEAGASYEPFGFLNDRVAKGEQICGLPVFGPFEAWSSLPADTVFSAGLHKLGEMPERIARIRSLGISDDRWAMVRHPMTQVSNDALIGRGVFLASFVTVQPGAKLGDFVTVRPGAHVSHETTLGDFSYVGSNATISGRSSIGVGAHVGPNAVVREYRTVGDFAIVGMGAIVTKPVAAGAVVAGNPARVLRHAGNANG